MTHNQRVVLSEAFAIEHLCGHDDGVFFRTILGAHRMVLLSGYGGRDSKRGLSVSGTSSAH